MQVPAPFEYERATSVEHALALLARHGPEARLVAGGHSLLPMMKLRLATPGVADRHQRPRERARLHPRGGRRGADRRDDPAPRDCSSPPLLARRLPIFADAERVIADPVVRNRGTIGGSLCQADPAEDLSAVCAAVDAHVRDPRARAASASWRMREFHAARTRPRSSDGEMLTEIRVPITPTAGSAYEKVERRVGDWAVAAAGAAVRLDGGTIADAGIGLTAVGAERHVARGRGARSRGSAPTEELFAEAGRLAAAATAIPWPTSAARPTTSATWPASSPAARCAGATAPRHCGEESLMQVTHDRQRRGARARRRAAAAARALPARRPGPDRHALGLRHLQLRDVRGADGRRAGEVLHRAGRHGRRHEIRTVEGLEPTATLDPVQQGFMEEHGLQCGFCTPGMMLTARGAARPQPRPDRARDPRGDLRPDLPLHRLREHRPVGPVGRRAPAAADAAEEVADVDGRPPRTGHPIGFGRMQRKEDARFVRGQGNYVDDIAAARHAARRHPAQPRRPRPDRVDRHHRGRRRTRRSRPSSPARTSRRSNLAWMPTLSADVQAVLATDKVRFQGQEVAFVVAEDRYAARDALELIDVEYEVLPPVVDARKALDPDAPVIRDDIEGQTDNHIFDWEAGDTAETDAVFADADVVVAAGHALPARAPGADGDLRRRRRLRPGRRQAHAVVHDPGAARAPHALRARRRHPRAQDPGRSRPTSAAASATRSASTPATCCAVVGSIVTGKPVKWMEDRSENLMATSFARDYLMHGEIAATKDGKILGVRVDVLADHGAFNATAQPTKYPAGFFHIFTGSYDLAAAHCSVTGVYTNKAPGGVAYACSFRVTEAVYLVERMVDCWPTSSTMDPAELRLKNLIRPEQFPYTNKTGWEYDSGDYENDPAPGAWRSPATTSCAASRRRSASAASSWASASRSSPRPSAPARASTWTSSASAWPTAPSCASTRPARRAAASRVQTQGQGHETTFAQIVAEELGIPPEDIEVVHGDTDQTPFGLGTYGSPLDAGQRRGGRHRRAQGPRQGADHRGGDARGLRRGPRVGEGPLVREGRPGAGQDDPGDRHGRPRHPRAARGRRGQPGRRDRLRPAEPDVPVRRLHLRRRRRPGHRRR